MKLDLKLTMLSAIISPYLLKFIKHSKSDTAFLHEIIISLLFFAFLFIRDHLCDKLIQPKDKVIRVNFRCNDHSM